MRRLGAQVEASSHDARGPKLTGTVRAVGAGHAWVELCNVNGNPNLRAVVVFDLLRRGRVSMPGIGSVIEVVASETPTKSESGTTLFARSSAWFLISEPPGGLE